MNTKIIKNILIAIILIVLLLFILIWANLIQCNILPGLCNFYWSIMGPPKILIAHGYAGMGNYKKLINIFQDKDLFDLRVYDADIDSLTPKRLANYDLVIVTQAKVMSAEQLKMFCDYAETGGRLIWTGDAGTMAPNDEKNIKGPWVRITKDNILVEFNKCISADYISNFCNSENCNSFNAYVGKLYAYPDSIFSKTLNSGLEFYGNFALVDVITNATTLSDMYLDLERKVKGKSKYPFIIASGVGYNKIYIASPLEYLVNYHDDTKNKYFIIPENIYKYLIGYSRR